MNDGFVLLSTNNDTTRRRMAGSPKEMGAAIVTALEDHFGELADQVLVGAVMAAVEVHVASHDRAADAIRDALEAIDESETTD